MAISEVRRVNRTDCRVLIVEDEYFLAADLETTLRSRGAQIVGPIADLTEAKNQIADGGFDIAVLDIGLRDEPAYVLADELMAREIPFVFLTGYSADVIPARFAAVLRLEKPMDPGVVAQQVISPFYRPLQQESLQRDMGAIDDVVLLKRTAT